MKLKEKFDLDDKDYSWCLYLEPQVAKQIVKGKKEIKVPHKWKKHIGEELYLISDKVYGTIILEPPIKSEDSDSKDLMFKYKYEFYPFDEPVEYKKVAGVETFTKSVNISMDAEWTNVLRLSDIQKDFLSNIDTLDLITLHVKFHNKEESDFVNKKHDLIHEVIKERDMVCED